MPIKIPSSKIYGTPQLGVLNANRISGVNTSYSDIEISSRDFSVSFDGFKLTGAWNNDSGYEDIRDSTEAKIREIGGCRLNLYEDKMGAGFWGGLSTLNSSMELKPVTRLCVKWQYVYKEVGIGPSFGPSFSLSLNCSFCYNGSTYEMKNSVVKTTEVLSFDDIIGEDHIPIRIGEFYKKTSSGFFPSIDYSINYTIGEGKFIPFVYPKGFYVKDGNIAKFLICIPVFVKVYSSDSDATRFSVIQSGSVSMSVNNATSTEVIDFYGNTDTSTAELSVSELSTKENQDRIAEDLIRNWREGRRTVEFDCIFSDYKYYFSDSSANTNVLNIKNKGKLFNPISISAKKYTTLINYPPVQTANVTISEGDTAEHGTALAVFSNPYNIAIFFPDLPFLPNMIILPFEAVYDTEVDVEKQFPVYDDNGNQVYAIGFFLRGSGMATLNISVDSSLNSSYSLMNSSWRIVAVQNNVISEEKQNITISLENPSDVDIYVTLGEDYTVNNKNEYRNYLIESPLYDFVNSVKIPAGEKSVTVKNHPAGTSSEMKAYQQVFVGDSPYIKNIHLGDKESFQQPSDSKYVYRKDILYQSTTLDGDSHGFVSVGDVVVPMKNAIEPLLVDESTGFPVEFKITSTEYSYTGKPMCHIKALEFIDESIRKINLVSDDNVSQDISTISSISDDYIARGLKSGDPIWVGDVLSINAECPVGYRLSINVNGVEVTGDSDTEFETTINVTGDVDITMSAIDLADYILTISHDENSSVEVERTFSEYENVSLGGLNNNDIIYIGDRLKVTMSSGDLQGYQKVVTVNGSQIENGSEIIVSGNVAVSATIEEMPSYTLTTNKSNVVTRVASPIAGASTGTLTSGAKIYEGDQLSISTTNDIRTYTIKNAGVVVSSGTEVYGGKTVNLTVTGDVSVSITYMDWRWVEYYTSFSSNLGDYISGSSGTYSTTISSANFKTNGGKGIKMCQDFSSPNTENRKEYYVESFSWRNAYSGNVTKENVYWGLGYSERYSEGDISVVDGQSFGFTQWDADKWNYAIGNEYAGGFGNMVSIDCKQDGTITITVKWRYHTGGAGDSGVVGSTEYYNGYIDDIKIYLYQWEYS